MATDLPEDTQLKRRARRRLIGAIALVLLAVIVLPMIFDAEKKPLDQDVNIQIPSQGDYVAQPPPAAARPPASTPPADGAANTPPADGKDVTPAKAPQVAADTPAPAKAETPPPSKDAPPKAEKATPPKADSAKGEKAEKAEKAAKAPEKAPEKAPKPPAKSETAASDDGARAAALLNGSGGAPTSGKSDTVAASTSFMVQVAAFSSAEKAQEARDKLSAAGLKSVAEKVSTKSGEVTRVRVGPYASRDAADAARGKIAGLGFGGAAVVHR